MCEAANEEFPRPGNETESDACSDILKNYDSGDNMKEKYMIGLTHTLSEKIASPAADCFPNSNALEISPEIQTKPLKSINCVSITSDSLSEPPESVTVSIHVDIPQEKTKYDQAKDEWIQTKPSKEGVLDDGNHAGKSETELRNITYIRLNEKKNCALDVNAADFSGSPGILESESGEQQWISTGTRTHKMKKLDEPIFVEQHNSTEKERDHKLMHVLLYESSSSPKKPMPSVAGDEVPQSVVQIQDEFCQSKDSLNEMTCATENVLDEFAAYQLDCAHVEMAKHAQQNDREAAIECAMKTNAVVQTKAFSPSKSISLHADNNTLHPRNTSSCEIPVLTHPMQERNLSNTVLDHFIMEGNDAIKPVVCKTTKADNAILHPSDPTLQGKRLLEDFNAGKVNLKQLSVAEIDAMTIAMGKTKLKGNKTKQDKLLNLVTLMRSTMSLNEPCASFDAVPALEATNLQPVSQTEGLSEIEKLHCKYGPDYIAKMLADRIVECPSDIDDMFTRLQIIDMLAVTEGSFRKTPRSTRILHELSADLDDNQSKLMSKIDQFAALIEKSMKPISNESLNITGSPKQKKKRSRISLLKPRDD
jgi:hypothetical protein